MKLEQYAPTVLRIFVGLLFVLPGFDKLMGMLSGGHMIAQMIGPTAAWVVLLVELVAGIALIVGYKVKWAAIPLVIIMAVAIVMTVLPSFGTNPMAMIGLLFHLVTIAALASLYMSGPGAYAVS